MIGVVPVAVTWNVPPVPLTTGVLLADVIAGAAVTAPTLIIRVAVIEVSVTLIVAVVAACEEEERVPLITPVAGSIYSHEGPVMA